MLVSQLPIVNFPVLHFNDTVSLALQLMDDYDVQHLPLEEEDLLAGIIAKNDLFDEDESATLAAFSMNLIKASVQPQEHYLSALKAAASNDLTLLPVVNVNQQLQGVITGAELLRAAAAFQNVEEPGAIIVLEMERINYAVGELSRLVETNNASIVQLNTFTESGTGLFIVTIRLNKTEVSDVLATLQRYDYNIRYFFGEEGYENELRENYDSLMNYLKI